MIAFLQKFHPVIQALLATGFTWAVTALGAATVFAARDVSKRVLDTMPGFAGGVMIAASYWSLLAPAIESRKREMFLPGFQPQWAFSSAPFSCEVLIGYCPIFTWVFPLRRPKVSRHPSGAAPCLSSP